MSLFRHFDSQTGSIQAIEGTAVRIKGFPDFCFYQTSMTDQQIHLDAIIDCPLYRIYENESGLALTSWEYTPLKAITAVRRTFDYRKLTPEKLQSQICKMMKELKIPAKDVLDLPVQEIPK